MSGCTVALLCCCTAALLQRPLPRCRRVAARYLAVPGADWPQIRTIGDCACAGALFCSVALRQPPAGAVTALRCALCAVHCAPRTAVWAGRARPAHQHTGQRRGSAEAAPEAAPRGDDSCHAARPLCVYRCARCAAECAQGAHRDTRTDTQTYATVPVRRGDSGCAAALLRPACGLWPTVCAVLQCGQAGCLLPISISSFTDSLIH